jgi:hypothetical protein
MIGEALRSYLWAYCCVVAIPLGGLAIVMLQHLTGGAWGVVIRRPLEAAIRTMPIMAILFLPIALGAERLYPWAEPGAVQHDPHLAHKAAYLNLKWFWIRAGIYFGIWMFLGLTFSWWSGRQDSNSGAGFDRRFRLLAGPGLALYGLTITFASIDWVMSLEPEWFSSIFGVLFGVGQLLSAFSFGIIVVLMFADRPPYRGTLTAGHLRDLGNLLLAFVMIWAYLSVSQLILIWCANIREEVPYYQRRVADGWGAVAVFLAGFQFAAPFLALLGRGPKRTPSLLFKIAMVVFVMRFVDLYWLIAPARPVDGHTVSIADAAAIVGLGGLWLTLYSWELSRRPLLPIGVDASVAEDHHV